LPQHRRRRAVRQRLQSTRYLDSACECCRDEGLRGAPEPLRSRGRCRVSGHPARCSATCNPATATAIEFHHGWFDHYFVTADGIEVSKLDEGIFAGWKRTGREFKVYTTAGPGLSGVCRFFSISFSPRSSHFDTALPGECADVRGNPDWQFEAEVFFVGLPALDGSCAAGTIPLYRLFNNGVGGAPNHRLTTDLALREDMLAKGWIAEGLGIGVAMCAAT
jgi:hypothetical protein